MLKADWLKANRFRSTPMIRGKRWIGNGVTGNKTPIAMSYFLIYQRVTPHRESTPPDVFSSKQANPQPIFVKGYKEGSVSYPFDPFTICKISMNGNTTPALTLRQFTDHFKKHRRLLIVPTITAAVLSMAFVLVKTNTWKASQSFMIRDEAIGSIDKLGRFGSTEARKAAQEIIVEIAQNATVARAALESVGPENSTTTSWPTERDVEEIQGNLSILAPKGAEFGSTDVLRLEVKADSKARAIALTKAIFDNMEEYLQKIRDRKAESIVAELEKTLALNEANLNEATKRLEEIETDVGSDLGELRTLSESNAGESNLRSVLTQLKNEMRQVRIAQAADTEKKSLLTSALNDPAKIVATPNQLLDSQPSLKKLKEGLIESQLRSASMAGKYNDDHPLMKEAISSEKEIREKLHSELENALRGLDAEMKIRDEQLATLEKQYDDTQARMDRLASLRARYSNLISEVKHSSDDAEKTRTALTEAKANQNAARAISLITHLDEPITGENPIGPSRSIIVAGGTLGGIIAGLGLLFLTMPNNPIRGRRWSDYLPFGRRATDKTPGRRTTDKPAVAPSTQNVGRRASDTPTSPSNAQNTGRRSEDRGNPNETPVGK